MTRKLATIQKIVSLDPIPDADKIEKATVLGWECVVAKKDQFQVGDLVIYIEVDSIVPDKPEYEFLRSKKFRVRTIRLRKQISQGLVLPLTTLPKKNWKEGDDVTEVIGVKKYDPQGDKERRIAEQKAQLTNSRIKKFLLQYPWYRRLFVKPKRLWPKFIKKTDEDRIQLFPHICENEKDTIFQVTEKLDGQSGTYFVIRQPKKKFLGISFGEELVFGVCSRKLWLKKEDDSSWWTVAKQFDIENILKSLILPEHKFIVLQGEIVGTGKNGGNVQDNKYGLKKYDFYAFNLFNDKESFDNFSMNSYLHQHSIKCVPFLESPFYLLPTIPEMVEYATGKSTIANIKREGIVVRNYEKNISFKVINPEFLIKYEEKE